LTDFTWYCNQRYALTRAYVNNIKRDYPIYSTVIQQTRPGAENAAHGVGEYHYFGTYMNIANETEADWMKTFQNYMSNFIRTGSPNGTTNL